VAIVCHTGAVRYARFLLFVRREMLGSETLVFRLLDGEDRTLSQRPVTLSDMLPSASAPPSWSDFSGPWFDDVQLAALYLTAGAVQQQGYLPVLVELEGDPRSERIELGVLDPRRNLSDKNAYRPYYVAAIEAQRGSEIFRHEYDSKTVQRNRGVLASALGPESSDNALLRPDTVYSIEATWQVERGKRDDPGAPVTRTEGPLPATRQTFWFRTDARPPQRLDPWLLCTLPADFEQGVFAAEPVRLVFATHDIARLYDTYGQRLEVRFKAASFRRPESTPAVPHPFPIDPSTLKWVKAQVLSPWEEAVSTRVAGECIPVDEERVRHSMVTVPIPLDPLTDYVMDVEYVRKDAPRDTPGTRVLRRSFTTSAFRTLEDFALGFRAARVQHRFCRPGALRAIGVQFTSRAPEGPELDQALMAAGLEPMPVPDSPRVVVFWEQTTPASLPSPAAVLVDATEAMWRGRPYPQKVSEPPPSTATRWELVERLWLSLEQAPGGDAVVDRIVPAPGGQRALVTLEPGARGKTLKLVLRRKAQPEAYLDGPAATDELRTVADIALLGAPWEED
jgi:large repetitive protein